MTKAKRNRLIYNIVTFALVIAAFIILQSMIANKTITRTLKGQLVPICCWIVMAVSLNLVIGISGELSLGHAGFMSVGAYTGAVVSGWLLHAFDMQDPTLRLVLAIVAGGLLAGIVGALIGIPVLRLRGDYLAIVTLAFGEIIRNLVNVLYIGTANGRLYGSFLNKELPEGVTMLVDGAKGAVKIKPISTFTAGFVLILITLIVVLNLVNSRAGRAIKATRDNRIAAESMGVPVTKYKMMAFVTAAVLAGMAGALYGLNSSTVVPTQFTFNQSINVLVFVVLGGLGNVLGSVISATLLTVLPEVLRAFSDYRMLVYAVVLILVMIFTNNPTIRSFLNRLIAPPSSAARKKREVTRNEPDKRRIPTPKWCPCRPTAIVPERDVNEIPVLEARHLGIEFGGLKAVDDFNLTIGKTEIAGLIGPNGAGKTTVFNLITKVYEPTMGAVLINGRDTSRHEHRSGQQAGHRPHLPEHPPLRQDDGGGKRAHRPAQPDQVRYVQRHPAPAPLLDSGEPAARKGPGAAAHLRHGGPGGRAGRAACPTAPSAGWRSCAPWPPTPSCCCWTSPPRA